MSTLSRTDHNSQITLSSLVDSYRLQSTQYTELLYNTTVLKLLQINARLLLLVLLLLLLGIIGAEKAEHVQGLVTHS